MENGNHKVPHTFCHVCQKQTPLGSDRDTCYSHNGPRSEKGITFGEACAKAEKHITSLYGNTPIEYPDQLDEPKLTVLDELEELQKRGEEFIKNNPLPKTYGKPLTKDYTIKEVNDGGETMKSIEDTLKERGNRYGEFENHAELSQNIKAMFNKHVVNYGQPDQFTSVINEAVEMIIHKLARIANGDPQYDDNFRDIAGYAELAVKDINK